MLLLRFKALLDLEELIECGNTLKLVLTILLVRILIFKNDQFLDAVFDVLNTVLLFSVDFAIKQGL